MKNSILIVDDSEDTRELFQATLESEGFAVLSAESGERALEILASQRLPSLMLLDLRMPNMSGVEVLQEMERRGLGKGMPILVVSAVDELPSMRLPPAVIGTLKKPFFYPELIFKIKGILEPRAEMPRPAHP